MSDANGFWPPIKIEDDTLTFSPSQISLMQRCTRQWGYKYILNREPATDSVSSGSGKAFHSALEPRFKAPRGVITPGVVEAMHLNLLKGFQNVQIPEDDYRTLGRYQRLLDAYNAHYKNEQLTTLGVEIPIMVQVGTLTYQGRPIRILMKAIIDRLVRTGDGLVLVADTKTSKDWRPSNQVMWERAAAPKAYTWGVMELARLAPELGLPPVVHGFMLDSVVVRREEATLRSPRRNGVADQVFQRIVYSYTREQLEEWRRNALLWIEGMLRQHEQGELSHNESQCSSWFGRTCPYINICCEPDAKKRKFLLSFDVFQDRRPSPFEKVHEGVESEVPE